MKTNLVTMTIADYCAAFDRNEVRIDRTYQRSPEVWPPQARSYLIETILKGYPIPKLALHQVTDVKSRRTVKYVVDGQQRSLAIRDFFNNSLRLSRNLELSEAANNTYLQLSEELQENFLSYPLYFDQFEASTEENVREYFRRINSFTAPLNNEEQRHAKYQGTMKWFIYFLTERYSEALVNLTVLPKQSVIRMADTKFFAEIVHALLNGVTTTDKRSLDSMYRTYDKPNTLSDETSIRTAIDDAISAILDWSGIREAALMRMNIFYSLVLALILVQQKWVTLRAIVPTMPAHATITTNAQGNLLKLAAALDQPELFGDYKEFTDAAAEKTNVKAQREKRVRWLAQGLFQLTI